MGSTRHELLLVGQWRLFHLIDFAICKPMLLFLALYHHGLCLFYSGLSVRMNWCFMPPSASLHSTAIVNIRIPHVSLLAPGKTASASLHT